MKKTKSAACATSSELRRLAKERLKEKQRGQKSVVSGQKSVEDTARLVHELQVHQIELEMQNEELRAARAELEASRARYLDLYEFAPVGYCTLSAQGLILEANLTVTTLLGTARGALVRQPIFRFILKDDQDIYSRHRTKLFETGEPQECDLRLVKPDDATFWAHLSAIAVQAQDGAPVCRIAIIDITERRLAEDAVRQTEERYRTLFASSRDAIMTLFPPDWKFTSANASTVKMFGAKDEKDFVSMAPWDVSPERQPDGQLSAEKAKRMIETAMGIGSYFFEWTHRRIGGDSFPATVLLTRVEFGGQQGLQATVRDITQQKRSEEDIRALNASLEQRVAERTAELRNSEAKLALATSGTQIGIFERNILTGETIATEQHLRLLGLRPTTTTASTTLSQRYLYRDWAERVHPEDLRRVEAEMDRCRTERTPFETQYRIVWPDGSEHWVAVRGVFQCDDRGKSNRLLGIMMDITAQKQAEEALRHLSATLEQRVVERTAEVLETEGRFRTIFDTTGDGLFVSDMTGGRFVMANKACLDILGYTSEEFTTLHLKDLHLPEDLPFIRNEIVRFTRGETASPADVRFKRKDGSLIVVEVYPNAVRFGGKDFALVAIRDVTERRRMEKELTQSHETLRGLLARLELAREEERTRVARDIHDDLGQNLTAIKMDLRWIERALEKVEAAPEIDAVKTRAVSAIEVADAMTATVQELATQLRPGVLDKLGLGPAIRFELRRFQAHSGIKCGASVPDALPSPAPAVATALFRILQECLTNVARHSGATRTSVRLDVRGNDLLLRVHDNGSGITAEALDRPQSLGLLGMKERAAVLDGQVTIRRNRNRGTVVTVRIPCAGAEDQGVAVGQRSRGAGEQGSRGERVIV